MKRIFYAAGVHCPKYATFAGKCNYWLLSFGSLHNTWPKWLDFEISSRNVIIDPGSFSIDGPSYQKFKRLYESHYRPGQLWLAYDEPGDGEATAWYLQDQRRRGMDVVAVWQKGMDPSILGEKYSAIGGLVPLPFNEKIELLKSLFFMPDGTSRRVGKVHLLGVTNRDIFTHIPAYSGDSLTWLSERKYGRSKLKIEQYGEQDIELL